MTEALRPRFDAVFSRYLVSRTNERFGKASAGWQAIMELRDALADLEPVRARRMLVVKASCGQGGWAQIPWIAFLDTRATNTTRSGLYVIYLFRADMTAAYLTLNQGVTEPLNVRGVIPGQAWLRDQARTQRARLADLQAHGFVLDDAIELRATVASGAHYAASTIAYRRIDPDALPTEAELRADLEHVLAAYEHVIGVAPPEE